MGGGCCLDGETWGLQELDQTQLATPRFTRNRAGYIIYRVGILLYWAFWVFLSGAQAAGATIPKGLGKTNGAMGKYFLYVTNITAVWQGVYNVLALAAAVAASSRYADTRGLAHLTQTAWVFRTVQVPAALLVTLLYWALVFDGDTHGVDLHMHAFNSVMALIDLVVARYPMYLKHIYFPFLYIGLYATFNAAYGLNGGRDDDGNPYIYGVLKYETAAQRQSSGTLLCVVLFIVFPIVYTVAWGLSRLAERLVGPSAGPVDGQPRSAQVLIKHVASDDSLVGSDRSPSVAVVA